MFRLRGRACSGLKTKAFALLLAALALPSLAQTAVPAIQANLNQAPGGTLANHVLTLELEVAEGNWFPESDAGPSLKVFAFNEKGKAPQIPGPLVRVPEGTRIHASIHNLLKVAVSLRGMHTRPGSGDDILTIPPDETREVTFDAGVPGAYYYWATTGGAQWQGRPIMEDSQLSGAFIVDPASGAPTDRVFVIGIWRDDPLPNKSFDIPVINGKSWPYTERLTYTAGQEVRWRWLNPSNLVHPMHMHGSYYRVDSLGDGERDTPLAEDQRKMVVTESMPIGGTMTTLWIPERAGNWAFHCHTLAHISPEIKKVLDGSPQRPVGEHHGHEMSGLMMGITVLPRPGEVAQKKPGKPRRKLELVVGDRPPGGLTREGYELVGKGISPGGLSCPGPAIVLSQGEPVEIRVTNHLKEPTAVHWHGIELESYYDGVPGFSGDNSRTTPVIEPGKSFDVIFTPPRAGTFIYHTHMKDLSQLASGLYGPIIVMPPHQKFDPATDKVFIFTRTGMRSEGTLLINGTDEMRPLEWQPEQHYRVRFINISANNTMNISITREGKPVAWTSVAKDGFELPPAQSVSSPALLTISPGETYDFEIKPETGTLALSAEIVALKEKLTQPIQIKPATTH